MPFNNLIEKHTQAADRTAITQIIDALENALKAHVVNLSPQERKKYGNLTKKGGLLVRKARDFRREEPNKSSPDVTWDEFEPDFTDSHFFDGIFNRMASIAQSVKDAQHLHNWDLYHQAKNDYKYTKYKDSIEPGYEIKREQLSKFFPNSGKKGGRTKKGAAPENGA